MASEIENAKQRVVPGAISFPWATKLFLRLDRGVVHAWASGAQALPDEGTEAGRHRGSGQ